MPYPDGCTRSEAVFDPETEELLVQVPSLREEWHYPKEQAQLDLVAAERLAGRQVLGYTTHTGTRDITRRMEECFGPPPVQGRGDEGSRSTHRVLWDADVEPAPLPDGLTAREGEVLRHIAAGETNARIAEALVISPATVTRHVTNILTKTDLSNRTELARYATEQGITD